MLFSNIFCSFAQLEPIASSEMDIIANIVVPLPDTIASATSPKEVFFHSCPSTTTQYDVALTHEVTSAILWAIGIIGLIIAICITVNAISMYMGQKLRLKHEENKRRDERAMQEHKDRLDSAWRCVNECYKNKATGVSDEESKMVKASWEYLTKEFNEKDISKSNQDK